MISSIALIFANGQECSMTLQQKLLSLNPTIVVLDSALFRLSSMVQPHVLIGDFDRDLDPTALQVTYPKLTIIHTPDQNKTDFEKGIAWLVTQGYQTIIILWGTGKRADHSFANMVNLMKFKSQAQLFMIDDYSIMHPLPIFFKKYYKKNDVISLFPVPLATKIFSQGLSYELDGMALEMGVRMGNSNSATQDGEVVITHEGDLLLVESRDNPDAEWVFKSIMSSLRDEYV